MMAALMADTVEGKVTPNVTNATCNAGGKLLKICELNAKYGTSSPNGKSQSINLLCGESPVD